MNDVPPPRDGALTVLKWLVIGLTATMLAGLVILVTLFATRFPRVAAPLPDRIALPEGVTATAFTRGPTWFAVVTEEDEILIYDAAGDTLRQRIEIVTDRPRGE